MKKALKFTIETQTEKHETISICHLNERVIALELSPIARKMFKLNKSLFTKINSSTKILTGSVYRHEIKKVKGSVNELGVKTFNDHAFKEVKIIDLSFSDNTMLIRQSILTKDRKRVSFNPTHVGRVGNIGGVPQPIDHQNLTRDDIEDSTMVCEIKEIKLFQDDGIHTYVLKDFMNDANGIRDVSYRIEIRAETEFKEYLDYIVRQLRASILFLTSYSNFVSESSNYDAKKQQFKEHFSNNIMSDLGISENESLINLGSDRIKGSEFGRAAINFYNASLLVTSKVKKTIYGDILRNLLPTSKTTPSAINNTVSYFEKLLNTISKEYNHKNMDKKSNHIATKIYQKPSTIKKFVVATTERLELGQEVLGYNLFSENQTGLNEFTISTYSGRVRSEQAKYYPEINASDNTNFMTSTEKLGYSNLSNAADFITPANLVYGNKKISCHRGLNNISVSDVKSFRMAKASMSLEVSRSHSPTGIQSSEITNNVMSRFNVSVGPPRTSVLNRSVDEEIDSLIDAKTYVGSNSYFVTDSPEHISMITDRLNITNNQKILSIISDVVPARFLVQPGSIETISDLQFSNKKSRIRTLISEKSIDLNEIPPQIKSMMSDSFQNNDNIDPLKNRESRAIIDETQKNIFLIKAHTGFEIGTDGFPDLNKPIFQNMSNVASSGSPLLAKGYDYEIPELGIVKDKFMPTIYNNLLYIGG